MTKILSSKYRFLVLLLLLFPFFLPKSLRSAPPTSIKDTLSSSQLSFFARLAVGNSTADTLLKIAVSGNPTNTTNNLFVGDTIGIGVSGANGRLVPYVVGDIGNTAQFQITTGIGQSNAFTTAAVIATRSAIHTITFTPKTNITNGAWQFLIKATSRDGEDENDGIPDQQGFDLGQDVGSTIGSGTRLKTADVTCPFGATASVGTTTIVSTNSYHVINCKLGAGITNPVDVEATLTVGRALSTGSQLVNPAPALSHTEGKANSTADTYTFYIRHLDAADVVVDTDTATGKIAVVESVRVTATVDPTLSFIIDNTNVGAGSTVCGHAGFSANATATTATSVAFGSLSLGAFNDLAHRLSCVTNADGGYIVTVYEIDPMTSINTGITIPDTDCDGTCNTVTAAEWTTDTTNSGWGYSLQNLNVGTSLFNFNNGGATFTGKAFADGAANAKQIMKNTSTPTTTETAYICYRLTASTIQKTGNYENQLIYTATATF